MRPKKLRNKCKNCKKECARFKQIYCSNRCQIDYQHKEYIKKWLKGLIDGSRGKEKCKVSSAIRRWLISEKGEWCEKCGWKEKNQKIGCVPLEINHIDGNSRNHHKDNLELLCPNCHSLTPTFKILNKGYGRHYRRKNNLPLKHR